MKTVRPNTPIAKTVENKPIDVNEDSFTVEELMESLLPKEEEKQPNPNEVKVEFTLTKRQYGIWEKKGGVKWLKKKLVN